MLERLELVLRGMCGRRCPEWQACSARLALTGVETGRRSRACHSVVCVMRFPRSPEIIKAFITFRKSVSMLVNILGP